MSHETLNTLERKVDDVLYGFNLPDDDIDLFAELWEMREAGGFTSSEWRRLNSLVQKFADFLIKDFSQLADNALNHEDGCYRVPELIHVRDCMRSEKLPSWIRGRLQPKLNLVYAALRESSRRAADSLVSRAKEFLDDAETHASNGNFSAAVKLWEVKRALSRVGDIFDDLPPHIKFVGLPAIARSLGTTAEEIIAGINARATTLQAKIPELEAAVKYEAENAVEIAAENRRKIIQQYQEAERLKVLAERDKMLDALKRRNVSAFKASQQLYENLKLGNILAAWRSMQEVQRHDGGIPAMMQADYSAAAQRQSLRNSA